MALAETRPAVVRYKQQVISPIIEVDKWYLEETTHLEPLNWTVSEEQRVELKSYTSERRSWLANCWREAQPWFEAGRQIDEVIQAAGVSDPYLGTSLRKSLALRQTYAEARELTDSASTEVSSDGWQSLYKETARDLGINTDRPGRDGRRLVLAIVKERRRVRQEILDKLDETDRNPLLVIHYVEQAAQIRLTQLREHPQKDTSTQLNVDKEARYDLIHGASSQFIQEIKSILHQRVSEFDGALLRSVMQNIFLNHHNRMRTREGVIISVSLLLSLVLGYIMTNHIGDKQVELAINNSSGLVGLLQMFSR